MKKVLLTTKWYIAALAVIASALAMGSRPVSGDRTPVRVVIPKGATAADIARVLNESGVLRSPFVFRLSCRMSGSGDKLKPGVFELNRAMNVPAIIDKLVNGESLELWVTLPEGFTVRQVADELASKQLADGDTFTRLAMSEGYGFTEYRFIDGENLEGYLFPDTYLVGREMDPEAIIRKMLDTFGKKVVGPLRPRIVEVNKARFGLSEASFAEGLRRILIMASLVEREAKIAKDRPLIAAVLWNRLDKNMKLEVCATVSYRPGESTNNKHKVYFNDLRANSPYNTYLHAGLPPAPICNPGLASIKAVINPANTDYLFYVARPDGSHAFSRTFQGHLAAKHREQGTGNRE